MKQETKNTIKKEWEAADKKSAETLFEIVSADKSITQGEIKELDFIPDEIKAETAKRIFLDRLKPWTVQEHIDYCKNYTSIDDFTPTGYLTESGDSAFSCKRGTITTIAGRTGHGKSQLLVQLCIDAIKQQIDKETKAKNRGKRAEQIPIIFLSFEMTKEQTARRFMRNLMFCDNITLPQDVTYQLDDIITIIEKLTKTENDLYDGSKRTLNLNALKDADIIDERLLESYNFVEKKTSGNFEKIRASYEAALKTLTRWEKERRLFLIDLTTTDNTITQINEIADCFKNATIFIDYMQRIDDDKNGTTQDYLCIKHICNGLSKIAIGNNQIIIIASQFNRTFDDDKSTYPSELQLSKLSEGSDIEKISHNVIGFSYVTRSDGTRQYYYKIMKQREGGHENQSYKVSAYLGYSRIIPSLDEKDGHGIIMHDKQRARSKKESEAPAENASPEPQQNSKRLVRKVT